MPAGREFCPHWDLLEPEDSQRQKTSTTIAIMDIGTMGAPYFDVKLYLGRGDSIGYFLDNGLGLPAFLRCSAFGFAEDYIP